MIAASRELRKTSQKTLAEGIGVQAQVISAMENGRRPVSRNMAAKLGKFFKCSPKIFFAFPDNL